MEHILNIAFDFDDEKVRKTAERAVENEMDRIIQKIVTDEIAPMDSGWYGEPKHNWNKLWNHIDHSIDRILTENRDEIIEKAADKLVRSVRASKAWKTKFADVMEGVDE